jgi:hypothetical protein
MVHEQPAVSCDDAMIHPLQYSVIIRLANAHTHLYVCRTRTAHHELRLQLRDHTACKHAQYTLTQSIKLLCSVPVCLLTFEQY